MPMVAVVADSLTLRDLSVQHNSIFFAERCSARRSARETRVREGLTLPASEKTEAADEQDFKTAYLSKLRYPRSGRQKSHSMQLENSLCFQNNSQESGEPTMFSVVAAA